MEYSTTTTTLWNQNQTPNPNPNLNPPQPESQSISTSLYTYDPPSDSIATQFYSADPTATLTPPGVDSYSTYPHVGYYWDPNSQSWAAKEAVQQYGSDPAAYATPVSVTVPFNGIVLPNGTEQLVVPHPGPTTWANLTFLPQGNGNLKKHIKKTPKKKTKVVQSAYCEICKVDCNSKDVLDQHKLGKKHKKNLEKLQAVAARCSSSAGSSNPVIGPKENPNKSENGNGQRNKKKAAESLQDLETKKRKILQGGAAAEAVRACSICNVVCNSDTVFSSHLAGQKHASMLKKYAAGIKVATAT